MHKKKPFFSIIIPAYNSEGTIKLCLNSILRNKFIRNQYEIIVIDNFSKDNTPKVLQKFNVKVIRSKGNVPELRNLGAKHAQGKVLAFLDSDCEVANNWLEIAYKQFKKDNTTIGCVGNYYSLPSKFSWIAKIRTKTSREKNADWFPGGNLFISKDRFNEMDGFDKDLNLCEDQDICLRLAKKGYRIIKDPKLLCIHYGMPSNTLDFIKKETWHKMNLLKLCRKHDYTKRVIPSLLFALSFSILIILFFISLPSIFLNNYYLLLLSLFLTLSVSILASLYVCLNNNNNNLIYFLHFIIFYFLYGIANGLSILKYSQLKKLIIKK